MANATRQALHNMLVSVAQSKLRIFSSPFSRARETAELVAANLGFENNDRRFQVGFLNCFNSCPAKMPALGYQQALAKYWNLQRSATVQQLDLVQCPVSEHMSMPSMQCPPAGNFGAFMLDMLVGTWNAANQFPEI